MKKNVSYPKIRSVNSSKSMGNSLFAEYFPFLKSSAVGLLTCFGKFQPGVVQVLHKKEKAYIQFLFVLFSILWYNI